MVRPLVLVAFVAVLVPTLARADDATGVWDGQVDLPGKKLGLRVVISGPASATIDIPEQRVAGATLVDVSAGGEAVAFTFKVPGSPAVFTGKRSGETVAGHLAQGGASFPFTLSRTGAAPVVAPPLPPLPLGEAAGLLGSWRGKLGSGAQVVEVELMLRPAGDSVGGSLDVPRQCQRGQKLERVARTADGQVRIEVRAPFGLASFTGKLAGDKLTGEYQQPGQTAPFELARGAAVVLPYDEEDVTYPGGGGVTLAGTLSRPRGAGRPPVVVFITGSGPQNRDECVVGVRPFAALADALARAGVAVLRSDDRGMGESGGVFATATPLDFAADTSAAVAFVRGRADLDGRRVGLLGHSEGGAIAPLVAAKDPTIAFLVLLAGPGTRLTDIIIDQQALISRVEGSSAKDIAAESQMTRAAFDLVRTGKPGELARPLAALATKYLSKADLEKAGGADVVAASEAGLFDTPWFRFYLDHDPAAVLAKIHCPVLAVNGALDLQVPPRKNLDAIKAALAKAGNHDVKTALLPGLNHLFQAAKTGSPREYATLPPVVDEALLATVTGWVTAHGGGAP